jgi:hypothetical protein
MGTHADVNPLTQQVAEDAIHRPQFLELRKDEPHHALHLFVRIESDAPAGQPDVAQRRRRKQLATLGLVQLAAFESVAHGDQFNFTHHPLEPKNQPIIRVARIVDAFLIGQQGLEESAQLKQLMPVLVGTRQAADLQAQDQAHMTHGNFRDQALKPRAVLLPLCP